MSSKAEKLAALREQIQSMESGQAARLSAALDADAEASGFDDGEERAPVTGGRGKTARADAGKEGKQIDASPEGAFARIVKLVSHAPRSSRDLSVRLRKEGYPEGSVKAAVKRAEDCLLVNDEAFAESFAYGRLQRGYGLARIKQELKQKGIDVERCGFWPEFSGEQSGDGEFNRALAFAKSHVSSSKHPGKSLYAALIRKGYSSGCAFCVLSALGMSVYD